MGGAHPARRLLLTQIAAGGALAAAAARAHALRAAFALPQCACGAAPAPAAHARAAARRLLHRALQKVRRFSNTHNYPPILLTALQPTSILLLV